MRKRDVTLNEPQMNTAQCGFDTNQARTIMTAILGIQSTLG